jgi:hypothetical protein
MQVAPLGASGLSARDTYRRLPNDGKPPDTALTLPLASRRRRYAFRKLRAAGKVRQTSQSISGYFTLARGRPTLSHQIHLVGYPQISAVIAQPPKCPQARQDATPSAVFAVLWVKASSGPSTPQAAKSARPSSRSRPSSRRLTLARPSTSSRPRSDPPNSIKDRERLLALRAKSTEVLSHAIPADAS